MHGSLPVRSLPVYAKLSRAREEQQDKENDRQNEDRDANVGNGHNIVENECAIEPGRRGEWAGLRTKNVFGDLLQRNRNAERGKEGLQRPVNEVSYHQSFHRHAGQKGHSEGKR